MTDRLYYSDAYCERFEAVVTRVEKDHGSSRVFLDRTAFYPTSGGQPFDLGTLGGLPVTAVLETETGDIAHTVTGTLDERQSVHGLIDWNRRFDHMQQHTGQHVLSAAFVRVADCQTVSFHLGASTATIDLQRELSREAVAEAVRLSNLVIWENRPVSVRFASGEEAATLPLRKESHREGVLRLVEIDNLDLSACGGTHVARTGEIGAILVAGSERFKGGLRVEFVCGGRALNWATALGDTTASAVRLLSVTPDELPAAIERLQAESRDTRRVIRSLQTRVAEQEASEMSARGERIGDATVVVDSLDQWDAAGLKTLAAAVTRRPGHVVTLFTAGNPALCVVAASPDLPVDAAPSFARWSPDSGARVAARASSRRVAVSVAPHPTF